MILNNRNEDLSVDFFDYVISATSDTMKCFNCDRERHLIRACPEKNSSGQNVSNKAAAEGKETENQNQNETETMRQDSQDRETGEVQQDSQVSEEDRRRCVWFRGTVRLVREDRRRQVDFRRTVR